MAAIVNLGIMYSKNAHSVRAYAYEPASVLLCDPTHHSISSHCSANRQVWVWVI